MAPTWLLLPRAESKLRNPVFLLISPSHQLAQTELTFFRQLILFFLIHEAACKVSSALLKTIWSISRSQAFWLLQKTKQDEVLFCSNQAAYLDNFKVLGKKNVEQKTITITVVSKKPLGRVHFRSETVWMRYRFGWSRETKTLEDT